MNMEVQIRPHSSHSKPTDGRPSMGQRFAQQDRFREAKDQLNATLKRIDHSVSSLLSDHTTHSGGAGCERCAGKKRTKDGEAQAYYTYYLDACPPMWTPKYRHELDSIYNDPRSSLDDMAAIFRSALRDYMRQYLAHGFAPEELEELFNEEQSVFDNLRACLSRSVQKASTPEAAAFIRDLQYAWTPEDRAQLYIRYYCSYSWDDPSDVKNFKAKYTRMFEQLMPYDDVVAAMRKEGAEMRANKLAVLYRQLNELQMAQSAHLKAKARKDQRMRDREPSPGMVQCSLPGCANEIDLATDETIECAVCDWLERRGSEKGRAFYCCPEHAEYDFDEHDRNDHQCCMGARCFFFPQAGPPGETGACGICQDCGDEFTSYFCSQDCYHHNLDLHREDFHMSKGIHNDSDNLEIFRLADDMELI